jgi:hypothetical protein
VDDCQLAQYPALTQPDDTAYLASAGLKGDTPGESFSGIGVPKPVRPPSHTDYEETEFDPKDATPEETVTPPIETATQSAIADCFDVFSDTPPAAVAPPPGDEWAFLPQSTK